MEKMQHFNIVGMIQGRGATSFSNIQEQLEKMTISKIGYLPTLNDLKEKIGKTLVCVTHNLTNNETEYLSWKTHPNLPCITALRMSSNLPLIFENYMYGNCLYVDGGISDNFAIDIGEKMGEKILGIVVAPEADNFSNETDVNALEFIYKLINVPIKQAINHKIRLASEKCKIINIEQNKLNLKFFEFNVSSSAKLNMFSSGYEQMKKNLE
jgi:predicted acylesterase/phospholipase RssA